MSYPSCQTVTPGQELKAYTGFLTVLTHPTDWQRLTFPFPFVHHQSHDLKEAEVKWATGEGHGRFPLHYVQRLMVWAQRLDPVSLLPFRRGNGVAALSVNIYNHHFHARDERWKGWGMSVHLLLHCFFVLFSFIMWTDHAHSSLSFPMWSPLGSSLRWKVMSERSEGRTERK